MESTSTIQPPRTIREVWESLPEGTRAEIIENQLIMSPPPLDKHQEILIEIIHALLNFVKGSGTLTTEVADFIASVNNFSNSFCREVSTSSKNN